jgi:metal-responsive CopG/Arc/MetJ family transcriptional regulator
MVGGGDALEQTTKNISTNTHYSTMVQISISLKPDLVQQIDEAKGAQSRSSFIVDCIYAHINPGDDMDKMQLTADLNAHKAQQLRLESEVAYLREQYSKINDALTQRLLTEAAPNEPKRSLWAKIWGR